MLGRNMSSRCIMISTINFMLVILRQRLRTLRVHRSTGEGHASRVSHLHPRLRTLSAHRCSRGGHPSRAGRASISRHEVRSIGTKLATITTKEQTDLAREVEAPRPREVAQHAECDVDVGHLLRHCIGQQAAVASQPHTLLKPLEMEPLRIQELPNEVAMQGHQQPSHADGAARGPQNTLQHAP
ncbi:unnamed protein product [Prorocentrum cordatum]|uniref:Uncharacterized protein n=1 Tax=Prorocentrum cordatum TaxID=2364126 RepID=A0ABN9T720_9DINO|nr:unnamed protein product [Polarella glacialis]